MAGQLNTGSPEWTQIRGRDQLPYGMHANCFAPCPPTPEGQLHWWPNCLCTYVVTPTVTPPSPFAAQH